MRRALARATRYLAREGLLAGPEGNLSVRLKDRILVTPSGGLKARLRPEEVAEVDLSGKILSGHPTSELPLHLALYRAHPGIGAVVHTHPPYTLALLLSGFDFSRHYLYEGKLLLGKISRVPAWPPGSEELARAVAEALKDSRVAVLERHGAVTVGAHLLEALNLTLVLEKVSRVIYLALALGKLPPPLEDPLT
ncbi:class II aldolase/adducin family protein [Thermosulfurimonas marina]|uniref:Class II aldolase/adducin family protein n=1 Tax=Thermosulfurimonas marina TaxID=2047767 RepID=A0A6H1WT82_9BACT|nr:class II aldolase/adducin family protein [Thermosulfurimonas marina]QJA06381.1 class II aldolase/adducin family protein [Thermosulfurimonas marina]